MKNKFLIITLLAALLTASCSENIPNQNQDQNINLDETVADTNKNAENQDISGLDEGATIEDVSIPEEPSETEEILKAEDIENPHADGLPTAFENEDLKNYIAENTVFSLANIEVSLSAILESRNEATAYFYLKGYTPSNEISSRIENDKNSIILTWITNKDIDIQNEFNRTREDRYEYLDENQIYLYTDYSSTYGVMKKQVIWLEHGTLFTLTMPASLYTETSTVEMFEVEIAENIEILESEEPSTETVDSTMVAPDSIYVSDSSEPIAVDPIIPPEIANSSVNP